MESFVSIIFFKKIKTDFSILVQRFEIFEKQQFCTKNGQNCQKCKLDEFFMSILKGLKWFSEKSSETSTVYVNRFYWFFIFFWFMIIQKAQKLSWKMRKMLFFKNSFTKCMTIVANLQQMLQKILSTIFWYLNSFEIFFSFMDCNPQKKKQPLHLKEKYVSS